VLQARVLAIVLVLSLVQMNFSTAADDPRSSVTLSAPAPTVVTHHQIAVDGRALRYTATAGFTMLRDKASQPTAAIFSVSYALEGQANKTRPVAFLWNGGPGSSSVWLHMGSFGPVRVVTNDTGPVAPPGQMVENEDTLLPATDLVFVDAPGTGYSKLVGKGSKDDYYGVDQDARAFTQFIQTWLTQNDRWASPKFLVGESYGTTRAVNVVNRLQEAGVGINGVVLISSALDLATIFPAIAGDDRSCIAFMPSEAAVAWYQHALPVHAGTLESFLDGARAFAAGPYATALLQGDTLPQMEREQIAEQLHAYLGLSVRYIEDANLRVDPTHFEKELLRSRGLVLGRFDARFLGYDLDRTADSPSYDPTTDAMIEDVFVSQFNRYVHEDLHFTDDQPYLPVNYDEVNAAWNFSRDTNDPEVQSFLPNVIPDLARALTKNPTLRVFAANGWFDLASPFFGTELAIRHLGIAPELRSHVTLGYYPTGHIIYLNPQARHKLRADISSFIDASTAAAP
jgi:carboxypeptidase C (cathepsin A)